MIFKKWRREYRRERAYKQCKELQKRGDFIYDKKILLFISCYEMLAEIEERREELGNLNA